MWGSQVASKCLSPQHLCSFKQNLGTSLAVQGLSLCTSNAGEMDSIPGQGTKIPHAVQPKESIKYIKYFFLNPKT